VELKQIAWRAAKRLFRVLRCTTCHTEESEVWYMYRNKYVHRIHGPYCTSCAAKLVNAHDAAHSVNVFYHTTRG